MVNLMAEIAPREAFDLWAGAYSGMDEPIIGAAHSQLRWIAPPWLTAADQTLLGRWLCLREWLNHYVREDMQLPAERAFVFWRGLRAVAEGRSAPTSHFGAAIADVLGMVRHLADLQAADGLFIGVGLGEWLDGLSAHYQWRCSPELPALSTYLVAAPRVAGALSMYALLSAARGWGLAELLPSSPVRRVIAPVGTALVLIGDIYGPANASLLLPILRQVHGQQAGERAQVMLNDLLGEIDATLRPLASRWHEFADWTRLLIAGWRRYVETLAAEPPAQS